MADKYDRSNLILNIPTRLHQHRPNLKTKEGTKLRTNSFSVVLVPKRSASLTSSTTKSRQYAKRLMTAPGSTSLNNVNSDHDRTETDGYYFSSSSSSSSSSRSSLGTPRIRCTAASPRVTPRTPELTPSEVDKHSNVHRLGLSHTPPSKSPSPFSLSEKSTGSITMITEGEMSPPHLEKLRRAY